MSEASHDSLSIDDQLPSLTCPRITRSLLSLYADASGDHNPVHLDSDYARKAGMPDVIAHGMLGMAWLGRLITSWVPQAQLRRLDVRFQGITHVGDQITCRGRVVSRSEQDGTKLLVIEIAAVNQSGQTKIAGTAVIATC